MFTSSSHKTETTARGERSRLPLMAQASGARSSATTLKTGKAFRDLRVEPSGKVTAANSYPKHNPTHYNQTNRRALTKLCLGQAAQNKLSSCGCKAVLQAPDFTFFSLLSLEPHRPATAPSLQLLKHSLLRHFKVAQKLPKQTVGTGDTVAPVLADRKSSANMILPAGVGSQTNSTFP